MQIDYKKELETASKGMIMIHDPELLIKMILRMIVRKLRIQHAGMILHDPEKDSYVLNISRGEAGLKIPQGFTRFAKNSPLIQLFTDRKFRQIFSSRNAIVSEDINRIIWRECVIDANSAGVKELLQQVEQQMQMLNTVACVPAYYHNTLMAVLLLGAKYDGTRFEQEELDFFGAVASDAAMAIRNAQLFEGLKKEAERNRKQFLQTIIVLSAAIEAKDSYTHGHTERVTQYSLFIARQMMADGSTQFPESFFENLYITGLMHDIGKIGVPESILNKQGKLTNEEFEIMKQHTVRGYEMVKPLFLPQECVNGIKYHHEHFDGTGYPEGLKGAEVPISATIIAVADTFDAMTTDRPYRKGLPKDDAMQEIRKNSGTQFNPLPVKAFLELYKKGTI